MQVYYVVKVIQHQNESINAVLQYLTAAGVPYVKLCPNFMTVQKQGTTLGIKTIKTLKVCKAAAEVITKYKKWHYMLRSLRKKNKSDKCIYGAFSDNAIFDLTLNQLFNAMFHL